MRGMFSQIWELESDGGTRLSLEKKKRKKACSHLHFFVCARKGACLGPQEKGRRRSGGD